MNTSIIVATDKKGGISKNGIIPWQIKEDLNFFMDVTKREYVKGLPNVLIMGKNTWQSCHIKDRKIIVVSTTLTDECVTRSLTDALAKAHVMFDQGEVGHIFICGGANIYNEAFSLNINTIYLSTIDHDYECDNNIDINVKNHTVFSSDTFQVISTTKTRSLCLEQTVNITFKKLYINLPNHWFPTEERQYLNLLNDVLTTGHFRQTRNSKTWSKFGKTLEFNLNRFPLLTSKKCYFFGAVEELLFMLRGDTNTTHLSEKGVKFWELNTNREFLDSVGLNHYEIGTMGPAYGYQLRHFNADYVGKNEDYTGKGFDQLDYCIHLLKTDPYSRRIIMTTYNPIQAPMACLFPCHGNMIIFNVELKNDLYHLSCMMTQRSGDIGCAVYLNVCTYGLLIYMLCEVINNDLNYTSFKFTPGKLLINLGDYHVYESHYSQAIRQLLRDPYEFPQLKFKRKVTRLTDFKYEDFELIDYHSYPALLFKMVA